MGLKQGVCKGCNAVESDLEYVNGYNHSHTHKSVIGNGGKWRWGILEMSDCFR